jgi:RNA polymerase sigma-70 factor (ECF subfamily)
MMRNNKLTEYNLALSYLDGNDEALGELYALYYSSLIMIAYRYNLNTEKSKDIVGQVFEKLLSLTKSKRQTFFLHPEKGMYPLLISIIKNKALDEIKQNKLHQEIKKQMESTTSFFSINAIFVRFEEEAIKQLIDYLSNREKEILQLHLQGFKNDEIATQLNISYNTVRNTLHSAKQRIKKLWQLFM